MADATPVLRPKQSARLAAQLYSPPLTWIWHSVALRNGTTPGSSRWMSAPSERKSRVPRSGMFKPYFISSSCVICCPVGMECALTVEAPVGMRAEVIALSLREIGRQPLTAICVEVRQRRPQCQHRNANSDRSLDEEAPTLLARLYRLA